MHFLELLQNSEDEKIIQPKYIEIIKQFYLSYQQAMEKRSVDREVYQGVFITLLELVRKQFISPFIFEPFHKKIRQPFDYYQFGLDFTSPLIDRETCKILGWHNLDQIESQLERGENAILFANHQTELDPQIISCLLEKRYPRLVSEMIFVAGGRVTSDPLAVPFSMGCNLLCIYSKKHIDNPPEEKLAKQLHNQRTMKLMSQLLSGGGKCIYVAPSGGRDRPGEKGVVEVSPFDSGSIEMFRLMALQASKKTHFYPLALVTYDLLPPPVTVEKELGEKRYTRIAPVHFSFGDELILDIPSSLPHEEKRQKRQALAQMIWEKVKNDYEFLQK